MNNLFAWIWKRPSDAATLPSDAATLQATMPRLSDADFVLYLYLSSLGFDVKLSESNFRCEACSKMRATREYLVWIEDGVSRGDPLWSVIEIRRRHAYNGNSSGWCLNCCRSFSAMTPEEMLKAKRVKHDPIPKIDMGIS